jgi:RhoGEF domain/Putative GTPase activating protein for Arf/PH domain/IQ calmodulin-binding motif
MAQKIDNVQTAISFMRKEMNIDAIGCNPQDIVAGNVKQIFGIIFLLTQKSGGPVRQLSTKNLLALAMKDGSVTELHVSADGNSATVAPSPRSSVSLARRVYEDRTAQRDQDILRQQYRRPAPTSSSSPSTAVAATSTSTSASTSAKSDDKPKVAATSSPKSRRTPKTQRHRRDKSSSSSPSSSRTHGRNSTLTTVVVAKAKPLQRVVRGLDLKGTMTVAMRDSMSDEERWSLVLLQAATRGWLARRHYAELLLYRKARLAALHKAFGEPARLAALVKAQARVRGMLARKQWKLLTRRVAIAQEILSTEETYVRGLAKLQSDFLEPLQALAMSPSAKTDFPGGALDRLKATFASIGAIKATNENLLNELRERMAHWYTSRQRIADIFLNLTHYLKCYTPFVNHYNTAVGAIIELRKSSPSVAQVLADGATRNGGLDIGSFMILPVQRIPRYVMLLSDLFKYTAPDHADYEDLRKALATMRDVAAYVNERKAAAENMYTVLKIQDQLTGFKSDDTLAQAHRRFVREGPLASVDESSGEKKQRYCFLFNDLMLVTTGQGGRGWFRSAAATADSTDDNAKFRYKATIALDGMSLADLAQTDAAVDEDDAAQQASSSSSSTTNGTVVPPAADDAADLDGTSERSIARTFVLSGGSMNRHRFVTPTVADKLSWMCDIDASVASLLDAKKTRHTGYPIPAEEHVGFDALVDGADKSGMLMKRAKDNQWRAKRLVLKNHMIYYEDAGPTPGAGDASPLPTDTPRRLAFATVTVQVRAVTVMDRSNCFELLLTKPQKRKLILSAQSNAERFEWISAIRASMWAVVSAHVNRMQRESDAARRLEQNARSKMHPGIAKLLEQPGNDRCADCSAPDPRWVSVNLGVYLCDDCGSIHRRLGAVSRVKPLLHGRWSEAQIAELQSLPGNEAANVGYERNVPDYMRKPSAADTYRDKTKYVQAKYTEATPVAAAGALTPPLRLAVASSSSSKSSSSSEARKSPAGSPRKRRGEESCRGYLRQRSSNGEWKRRYAILRPDKLALFTNEQKEKRAGSINLMLCSVARSEHIESLAFTVTTANREYVFAAAGADELAKWINSINDAISSALSAASSGGTGKKMARRFRRSLKM